MLNWNFLSVGAELEPIAIQEQGPNSVDKFVQVNRLVGYGFTIFRECTRQQLMSSQSEGGNAYEVLWRLIEVMGCVAHDTTTLDSEVNIGCPPSE